MIPVVFYYPKETYLRDPIDERLVWYQCSGLMNFWASKEMDYKYLSYAQVNTGPKPMSVEHLSGTFRVWFFACVFSIGVFLLEVFWNQIHGMARRKKKVKKRC